MKTLFQISLGLTVFLIVILSMLTLETTPLYQGLVKIGSISLLATFGLGVALVIQKIREDRKLRGKPISF
jgi:hypothetical protein